MSLFWREQNTATFLTEDILPPLNDSENKFQKDIQFWNDFSVKQNIKQNNSINDVTFSPAYPNVLSVCYGVKVQNYHPSSNHPINTISKFKATVRCATYRNDGGLLAVGDDSSVVKIFESSKRVLLKTFKGHRGSVRAVQFRPNKLQLVSASDDKQAILWDITSRDPLLRLIGHKDHIRSCAPTQSIDNYLTGSYDGTVKLWDLRTKDCTTTFDHGAPVEDIMVFPRGNLMGSVGGTVMRIWDLLTGKMVAAVSKHSKTITRIVYSHPFILTASLDRNVKIYDNNYNAFHSIPYSDPILTLAVSPKQTHFAVGMSNGSLSIKKKPTKTQEKTPQSWVPSPDRVFRLDSARVRSKKEDQTPKENNFAIRQQAVNRALRSFRYYLGLNVCLTSSLKECPNMFYTFLKQLDARGKLDEAFLLQLHDRQLSLFLGHLSEELFDHRKIKFLLRVAEMIIDVSAQRLELGMTSSKVESKLVHLKSQMKRELQVQLGAFQLLGSLKMVLME